MPHRQEPLTDRIRRMQAAPRPEVDAALSVDEALRTLMATCTATLHEALAFFLEEHHPAAVHRFRVTIRRIRVLLKLFKPVLPRDLYRYRRWLKEVARMAGHVRDLDVVQEVLHPLETTHPAARRYREMARERRETAVREFLEYLKATDFFSVLKDFEDALSTFHLTARPGKPYRVCHILPAGLWSFYGRLRAFDRVMPEPSPRHLHRFRNRCKDLRYSIDPFRGSLGKAAEMLITRLATVQDETGMVQDMHVTLQWLQQQPSDAEMLPLLYFLERRMETDILQQTPHWWQMIEDRTFREALGRASAEV